MNLREVREQIFTKKIFLIIFLTLLFVHPIIYLMSFIFDIEERVDLEYINDQELMGKSNIFFIETSFSNASDMVFLNKRDMCSVESAALLNPNAQVSVIFVTNATSISLKTKTWLEGYKNVAFFKTDLSEFSLGTPVEDWIKSEAIFESKYLLNNISNLLRLLLLWR